MPTSTDTVVNNMVFNVLTQAQYDTLSANNQINENELYLITDGSSDSAVSDIQINGTSIISNGIANLITNTAYDATSNKLATMADIGAAGGGTVTSVSISGTSPISASGTVTSSGSLSVSHNTSGVTAGTYVPSYGSKVNGYYFPSVTVNDTGHITSASNYGITIYSVENSGTDPGLTPYNMYYLLKNSLDNKVIHKWGSSASTTSAGSPLTLTSSNLSTTTTVSLTVPSSWETSITGATANSAIGVGNDAQRYIKIIGVEAFLQKIDNDTEYPISEPVLVDWHAEATAGTITMFDYATSFDVTVSATGIPSGWSNIGYYILYTIRQPSDAEQ